MPQTSKIKLMTDTCSDIPKELADELGIKLLCFPVTVDGKSFREVQDFSKEDFYDIIETAQEFPTTAQLTPFELQETFEALYSENYTDVIYVTIGADGSATNRNAILAKQQFEEDTMSPDRPMRIHIVDGRNYTATYGYAVVEAAKKLRRGADVKEILEFLVDWTSAAALFFVPLSLKYIRKSGRVSAAAAFAGELLGLRPLCQIIDCESSVVQKIRGEQNIVTKLAEYATKNMIPHTPYIVMRGCDPSYANALAELLTKQLGYPPAESWSIGTTVTCNAGPNVVGIIVKQQPRELTEVR